MSLHVYGIWRKQSWTDHSNYEGLLTLQKYTPSYALRQLAKLYNHCIYITFLINACFMLVHLSLLCETVTIIVLRTDETPWAHPGSGWLQTTRESIPGPVCHSWESGICKRHSHMFWTFNSQISNDTCRIQKYKYLDIIYAPSIHYNRKNKSCMQILLCQRYNT